MKPVASNRPPYHRPRPPAVSIHLSWPRGTQKVILVALARGFEASRGKIYRRLKYLSSWILDKVLARVYNMAAMAKYDSMRKLERNKMLREYAEAHKELSVREVGLAFNISESRAWRIIHMKEKKTEATEN